MSESSGGCCFVLEGIDGSGTTTQLERLSVALEARGFRVHATREPTPGPVGRLLRLALERRLTGDAEEAVALDWAAMALLFAADRVDHVRRSIEPALRRGEIVLCDRYVLSSYLYQSATSPLGGGAVPWLRTINERALRPDATFVLSIDPDVAETRRRIRGGEPELFEASPLQRELARGYEDAESLLPGEFVRTFRADQPKEALTDELLAAALAVIGARAPQK